MKLDFQHHDIMIFVSIDSDNENMFSMLWTFPWIPNGPFQHVPPRQAARAILEHWLSKDDRSEIINKDGWCYRCYPQFVEPEGPLDHGVCWS